MSEQTYVALLKRGNGDGNLHVSTVLINKKQYWQIVDKDTLREGSEVFRYPSEAAAQREITDTKKSLVGYDSVVLPYEQWLRIGHISKDILQNMYLPEIIAQASCTDITYGLAHTEMEP